MTRHLSFFLLGSLAFSIPAVAKTRISISVLDNKAASSKCNFYFNSNEIGTGFKDQLVTEIMKRTNRFEVMERQNLNNIHDSEFNLPNADKSSFAKKNGFKQAHYAVTGAVTEYEYCAGENGGDIDVGGLLGFSKSMKVGASKSYAKVGLDLRVVDVETGRILASVNSAGEASSTNVNVKGDVKSIPFGTKNFYNTPIGEASRDALNDAVGQLMSSIPDRVDRAPAASNLTKNRAPSKASVSQAKPRNAPKSFASKSGSSGAPARSNAAKSSTARNYAPPPQQTATANMLCAVEKVSWKQQGYVMCKLKAKTAKGQLEVISLATGQTHFIPQSALKAVPKTYRNAELGGKVVVNCADLDSLCYHAAHKNKSYAECSVIDKSTSRINIICDEKEFTINSVPNNYAH